MHEKINEVAYVSVDDAAVYTIEVNTSVNEVIQL